MKKLLAIVLSVAVAGNVSVQPASAQTNTLVSQLPVTNVAVSSNQLVIQAWNAGTGKIQTSLIPLSNFVTSAAAPQQTPWTNNENANGNALSGATSIAGNNLVGSVQVGSPLFIPNGSTGSGTVGSPSVAEGIGYFVSNNVSVLNVSNSLSAAGGGVASASSAWMFPTGLSQVGSSEGMQSGATAVPYNLWLAGNPSDQNSNSANANADWAYGLRGTQPFARTFLVGNLVTTNPAGATLIATNGTNVLIYELSREAWGIGIENAQGNSNNIIGIPVLVSSGKLGWALTHSVTPSGFITGNYSSFLADMTNGYVAGFPYWVSGIFSPSDPLWQWAFEVGLTTGNLTDNNGLTGSFPNMIATFTNVVINANGSQASGVLFHGNGGSGIANIGYLITNPHGVGTMFFTANSAAGSLAALMASGTGGVAGYISTGALLVGSTTGTTNTDNECASFEDLGSIGIEYNGHVANYTSTDSDFSTRFNAANLTNTIPDATAHGSNRLYAIQNANISPLRVVGTSGQTFNGNTSLTLAQNQTAIVQSDNTNWNVVAKSAGLITSNFVSGQIYTNTTGSFIEVSAMATLTETGVAGNATMSLQVAGVLTNMLGESTLIASLAVSKTNMLSIRVPAGSTYVFTNTSSGTGNSAGILGGQIVIY